jgi:EpsI family protein
VAVRVLIVILCLLATAAAIQGGSTDRQVPLAAPLSSMPLELEGFKGQTAPDFDRATVVELGVDDYVNRQYTGSDGMPLGLYVGYYGSQRQGRTIHSPLNCLPGSGWEPMSMTRLSITVAGRANPIEVNRYVVRRGLERLLILYWYQGRDRVVASEYWTKAFLVADAVRSGRTDGALVRIVSPLRESDEFDEPRAERRAATFVRALFPMLSRHLPS